MAVKSFFIILYILYPALMIAALLLDPSTAGLSARRLGGLAVGTAAYTMLCAQLILTARLPAVERVFGQDRLLRWHGIAALAAVALSFVHAFYIHGGLFTPRLRWGEASLALFTVLTVLAVFFLSEAVTGRWARAARFRKAMQSCTLSRYHTQLLLHNLTALAVVLLYLHAAYRMRQFWTNVPFAVLATVCFLASMGCWVWHLWLRKKYVYRVAEVVRENGAMTTIRLEPEGEPMPYLAGQFAYFRFEDPAVSEEYHPFTMSSSPRETLSITVKALGDWTDHVHEIRAGSRVLVDGPYGRFSPALHQEGPAVLIAGGVGVTPMMGIIYDAYFRGDSGKLLLLWCARDRSELIRRDEWTRLEKEMPGLTICPVLSREKAEGCAHGHLSETIVEACLARCGIAPGEASFYYCGPEPLRRTVRRILRALRVPAGRYHEERFSL